MTNDAQLNGNPVGFSNIGHTAFGCWLERVGISGLNLSIIFDEIEYFNADGSAHYELSSHLTKSGNPEVINIPADWFEFAD